MIGSSSKQFRCLYQYYLHLLSSLLCFGRQTVSGLLCTCSHQFSDWSSAYRLYSHNRIDIERTFSTILGEVLNFQSRGSPLVVALDDTLLRKCGKKIPGVKYLRDPLGPPFHINFVRGQRVIQFSGGISCQDGSCRMIPVLFRDAPSAKKPSKHASKDEWQYYREQQKRYNLSTYGVKGIHTIRERMDQHNHENRNLWICGDGSYTNRTILKNLPPRTVLIGRARADTKLYYLPSSNSATAGRKRVYGEQTPTPEQLRQDKSIPWTPIQAYAVGKVHSFKIKTISDLRWRTAGKSHLLRLIVIAPLAYRLTKKSRILYRKPSYIICTDTKASIQKIVQAYLWRWDIEVNFRDEKTLLGLGEAQVRNQNSVKNIPQMKVAAYALLLIAAVKAFGVKAKYTCLPIPKWQKNKKYKRATTIDFIRLLRVEMWGKAIKNVNFSHFREKDWRSRSKEKLKIPLKSALFYNNR